MKHLLLILAALLAVTTAQAKPCTEHQLEAATDAVLDSASFDGEPDSFQFDLALALETRATFNCEVIQ